MSHRLEADEQERKLFVGGLNKVSTDEDQLKAFFEQFGGIIDCTIMRDSNKHSRGFGFVLFEDASTVDKIITAKKEGTNFTIDDFHIEVKRALPKVPGSTAGTSRTGGLFRKIFVGGLPGTVTEDDLIKYFEAYGRVNEVELLKDRDTKKLRGFAFVTFDDEDSADKCIQRRTHEIRKKVCEVKRAQTRSTISREDDYGGRRSHGYQDNRGDMRQNPSQGNTGVVGGGAGGLSMNEVNQLIQQAFLMGQQSIYQQPGLQPPTASSLLNLANGNAGNPIAQPAAASNVLLQALMAQQAAPAAAPAAPIAPPVPTASASNTTAITQLAQLLQGRIDTNALGALLKGDADGTRPPAAATGGKSNGGYSTSYPSVSSYDMYSYSNSQDSSNYGPTKVSDDPKRGYRPY